MQSIYENKHAIEIIKSMMNKYYFDMPETVAIKHAIAVLGNAVHTTIIKFRYINPDTDTLDYIELALVGAMDANNVNHRQIAYDRLAEEIGEDEVQFCTISNWEVLS